MSESAQIDGPVETLARGASQNAMTHRRYLTRRAGPQGSAADLEGFAHSAAADGERKAAQGKKTSSDEGDMPCECRANAVRIPCECRANAVRMPREGRAKAVRMPCECRANAVRVPRSSPRRRPSGLTFLHVPAPAAIWSYVCACLSVGGSWHAIWAYVFACFSARGYTGFCLCMSERRR